MPTEPTPAAFPRLLTGGPDKLALGPWRAAAIAVFGFSLLLVNLGGARVLTYHEITFAEPAREMLTTGHWKNWILPTIAGVPFTDKPPATAWSIAAMMTLFGSDSELAARLPSVIAAVLTALMIASLAARWFGARVGLIAGLVQLTAYYTLLQSRLAESDMLLCATVCAAMHAFATANVDGPRGRSTSRWLPAAFYAAVGAAFLTKALIGPAFIASGCLAFLVVSQDRRGWRFFFDPWGLAILALLTVPWSIAAYIIYPPILDNLVLHQFGRFEGAMGEHEPFYAYLYLVPMLALPWTPFLAWGLFRGLREGHAAAPIWRFLGCWIAPGLVLLSLSAFKAKHYTMPLLPPLSIMAAAGLLDYLAVRFRSRRPRSGWLAAASLAGCAVGVFIVMQTQPTAAGAIVGLIALLGVGLLATIFFEHRRWPNVELAAMFGTAWLAAVGAQCFVLPHHDSYRHQTVFAERANQTLPLDAPIYLLNLPDNQITFYLERPLVRIDDYREFPAAARTSTRENFYVMAPRHVAERLRRQGDVEILDRADALNSYMTEKDRLTLARWTSTSIQARTLERKRNDADAPPARR